MQLTWRQLLLIAGGTAATAACLYYLLREDGGEPADGEGETKKFNCKEASKAQVMAILRGIIKAQEQTRALMKNLIQEIVKDDLTFDQAYDRVVSKNLDDPLDQYGVTMADFDGLLDKYQQDPHIKDLIMRILSASALMEPTVRGQHIDKEKVIEVHAFMREELQKLVEEVQKSPRRAEFDVKNLTLAAQAYVGAKVQKKFKVTTDDVELAVVLNHKELAVEPEFVRVNMGIQAVMNQLIIPHCVM